MKNKSRKRFISCTLAVMVLIMSTLSQGKTVQVNAIESYDIPSMKKEKINNNKYLKQIKSEFKLSDIPKELKEIDSVDALDLYSVTTIKKDNKRIVHIFDSPIKYYDKKKQEIKFIDNSFKESVKNTEENNTYAYENAENDIKIYIPYDSTENVSVEDTEEYH